MSLILGLVDASVKDGFLISKNDFSNPNPLYSIKTASEATPYFAFPKYYDELSNPHSGFAALMTCDHADGNCPLISGADICIPPHWEDPKIFNGISQNAEKYSERSQQIGAELFFCFQEVKAQLI